MKKLNRKGFVLAEAIVVAVFVLGMFTYLAVNIIPLITKYDQALNYDNPQEVYAANILLDEMISYKNNFSFSSYDESAFEFFMGGETEKNEFFTELLKNLNIKNIGLLKDSNCSALNRGMTEYCKYLEGRQEIDDVDSNNIMLLIEFKNNKFSHIKAKI